MNQLSFFDEEKSKYDKRHFLPFLTVSQNRKGVVDVDTVKGCALGMAAYPGGGCYGECYARKISERNGLDFSVAVSRKLCDPWQHRDVLVKQLIDSDSSWYRIGVMGDPCHDWDNTLNMINCLRYSNKTAIIITKHWIPLSDHHISRLIELRVIVHTSTSGMDTDDEIEYRVEQINRLRRYGILSINRVVSCEYGDSRWAKECAEKQKYLLSLKPVIDNPLRARKTSPRVLSGEIKIIQCPHSIGGGKCVSLHSHHVYLGHCDACPDQCGMGLYTDFYGQQYKEGIVQKELFSVSKNKSVPGEYEFKYVPSVIGSGYEKQVAGLALEDGIAHRAARKNMQIHSAIILLRNGEFVGFFTFQNNHEIKEFCLLQSVIRPDTYTPELYKRLASEVLARNTSGYPMLITTNPKSEFETPEVFKSLGFKTYLAVSGFEYMLAGDPACFRIKVLAHITMTNVWDSVKGEWIKLKKEWNEHISAAGIKHKIPNPAFATREGCWQGESGFANVVTGRSHNGNASVLDPVACEIILRFFMPKDGKRIYNPFGGGVQFGFISGSYGYQYVASEIRQNQCDANNKLCSDFADVKWVKSDSSIYQPDGSFDLVFTCPPYYRVERYVDYDGVPPDGEINALDTYEKFRDTLFAGYKIAIDHLNKNCFFVVMTGDSRDKCGAYYCSEAETELFLKNNGLSVYNKIVYLESEFTRLAQAKKTLNYRKFPKREQKIIVAYKGKIDSIKDEYPPIGRL